VFYVPPNNYGYVTYEHEEDLRKILRGGRLQLRGTDLKISEAKPREQSRRYSEGGDGAPRREREEEEEPNSRLFVKGVPEDASDAEIKAYFSTFGEVTGIYKMPPGKIAPTGKATRFMFVTFSKPQEMWKAIAADAHMFAGSQLRVSEAAPKPKNGVPSSTKVVEDCRIYVKGIPKEMSDDEVHQYFSNFGALSQVHRGKKESQGLQFMFVTFTSVQDMARALSHEPHAIGEVPLQVTKARARPEAPSRPDPWENQHPTFPPSTPLEQNYEDYRDPYTAALNAFAQSQVPNHGGWGEPARPSYKPDVNRGKQIREQRYTPY
jgi:RNA recognition motif-containing protein